MKDNELLFDRKSHVLYSKPCKKEILAKIALHYPEAELETVWEKVPPTPLWKFFLPPKSVRQSERKTAYCRCTFSHIISRSASG